MCSTLQDSSPSIILLNPQHNSKAQISLISSISLTEGETKTLVDYESWENWESAKVRAKL